MCTHKNYIFNKRVRISYMFKAKRYTMPMIISYKIELFLKVTSSIIK